MDKELLFEGKKYISAKRVAEIYGYNSDYIGQLCRENLIDAKRVGRVWFVSDEAIKNHKNGGPQNRATELPANFIAIKEAAARTGYSTDYLSHLCRNEQVECRMVQDKWFVAEESVLRYKESAEQKLRERAEALKQENVFIRKNTSLPVQKVSPAMSLATSAAAVDMHSELAFRQSEHNAFAASHGELAHQLFTSLPISGKVAFASIVALIAAGPFLFVSFSQNAPEAITRSTASVSGVAENVINAVRETYHTFAARFQKVDDRTVVSNYGVTEADGVGAGDRAGVVVVPSSMNGAADEAVKEYIKNSFSDEARVIPDEKGDSGIIQPVFKSGDEQNYVYVMVPLRE